jgi:septal ring-binding cell division protein DamX
MKRTIATLGVVGLGLMGATVAANAAPDNKITICHATGSASNPYLAQTINVNALSAHVGDTGDIVPANDGAAMPLGQNLTAANLILLANNCVAPPAPVDPDPVDPDPVDPDPVDPDPVDPGPVDPGPVDPGPVDPGPVDTVDAGDPPAAVVPDAVPPAAVPPAAVPPAAVPAAAVPAPVPAAAAVTPVASTSGGAAVGTVPAASNVGYNVQTAVGSPGTGIPAWLAALTGLFAAVGGTVLVKGGLRSRGANG